MTPGRIFRLAALIAAVALPAMAQVVDIDPANPPPWPAGRQGEADIPSRFDRTPPAALMAQVRAGDAEARAVLRRRVAAGEDRLLTWLRTAAATGRDREAMTLMGRILQGDGETGPMNQAQATRLFRQAAALGDPEAMRWLGSAYRGGRGVEKDEAQGVRWLTRAAEAGDTLAMFTLANLYEFGNGVPVDKARAAAWRARSNALQPKPAERPKIPLETLIASAEAGDVKAMKALGAAYAWGIGIAEDREAGFRWYERAAQTGDGQAIARLGELYQEGRGVRPNRVEGLRLIIEGAELGDRVAMGRLIDIYGKGGIGRPADPDKARLWKYRFFWSPDLPLDTPQVIPTVEPPRRQTEG